MVIAHVCMVFQLESDNWLNYACVYGKKKEYYF